VRADDLGLDDARRADNAANPAINPAFLGRKNARKNNGVFCHEIIRRPYRGSFENFDRRVIRPRVGAFFDFAAKRQKELPIAIGRLSATVAAKFGFASDGFGFEGYAANLTGRRVVTAGGLRIFVKVTIEGHPVSPLGGGLSGKIKAAEAVVSAASFLNPRGTPRGTFRV